jgi:response regulator RpfG family c-di-GMP phosphodiesterase
MEGRGTDFDPRVVDAFAVVKEEIAAMDVRSLPAVKIEGRSLRNG